MIGVDAGRPESTGRRSEDVDDRKVERVTHTCRHVGPTSVRPLADRQHDRVVRRLSQGILDRQHRIDVADLAVGSRIDLTYPRETVLESSARNEVRFGLLPRETPSVRMRRHDEMERRWLVVVAAPNEILQLARPDSEICNH